MLILGCRGVQIGDDNEQFNSYTYQLLYPAVDFSAVLRRPAVRDALRRLVKDPDNAGLRREAEDALGAGPWGSGRKEMLDLGPLGRASPSSAAGRDLKAAQGFVAVRNCQGVQTGNDCFQRNDFTYVCRRSTVDAHALLKSSSHVARSLVNVVINPPGREAADDLNVAVKAALASRDTLAAIPDRSVTVTSRTNVVRDRDGVSVGDRCHTTEFKALMVELGNPRNLPRSVVKESERLSRSAGRPDASDPSRTAVSSPAETPSGRPLHRSLPRGADSSRRRSHHPPLRWNGPKSPDETPTPPQVMPEPPSATLRSPSGPESPSSGRGLGL
ncbi:RIP homotypic interaction motif-containing protein [Streptomyces sp. NPDC003011]